MGIPMNQPVFHGMCFYPWRKGLVSVPFRDFEYNRLVFHELDPNLVWVISSDMYEWYIYIHTHINRYVCVYIYIRQMPGFRPVPLRRWQQRQKNNHHPIEYCSLLRIGAEGGHCAKKMINRARPTFISLRSSSDCLTLYIYMHINIYQYISIYINIYIYIYAYQYRTLFLDVYDFDFTWHHGYLRGRSLSRPCSGLDAQPRVATQRRGTTDELQQVRWQNCLDEPEESWEFCWGWSKNDYGSIPIDTVY